MSDPRFARLKTDPRFRRPKRKHQKVVVDERFKSVLESSKTKRKAKSEHKVDKYGRKLSDTHEEDNLKRYYRLAHGSDQDQDDEKEQGTPTIIDYARGAVLMESSDEEDEGQGEEIIHEQEEDDDSSDVDGIIQIGGDDDNVEIDLDEDTYAELDAQVAAYTKANQNLEEQVQKEDVGIENRTRRLAVVNLDWDHVRASHLYKIFSSLVSPTAPYISVSATSATRNDGDQKKVKGAAAPHAKGTVSSVRVYPSEFGKARMEREEREGPPAEIFKKSKREDNEEINERTVHEIGDEDEYDEDALRRYQLERLRYYYAIIECDTVEAASHIYNELDGTELEKSANVFDLSFVPDDMTFNTEPRDEATEDVSTDYKPLEYVTDALRHSKVKLTWDEDDPERYQVTRRQLTRKEIEEADFKAYIASSSDEEEDVKENKEASRQRLRALLLGGNDAMPEGWANNGVDSGKDSDVDMEITFTPGLSEQKNEENETTLEKYQRKMREKRKRRKEERKEKVGGKEKGREGHRGDLDGDEFFEGGSSSEDEARPKVPKGKKNKQKEERPTSPVWKESTAEELALIAASDNLVRDEPKHFNMKAVLKAEKKKKKKSKKGKANEEENELQEDFKINVDDERFKVLHEDHQFAIDPTNPHFKKTKGMKAFLEERRRRQKGPHDESLGNSSQSAANDGERSLKNLVENVKRKSQGNHGGGKRRKM